MKKTLISLILCLFYIGFVFAQQGDFIYNAYSDEWICNTGWGEAFYDINGDSISDVRIRTYYGQWGHLEGDFVTLGDCKCCCYSIYDYTGTGFNNFYMDLSLPLNNDSLCWGSTILREKRMEGDTMIYKPGLRIIVGENYYYGWLKAYTKYNDEDNVFYYKVTETCFCTIPNYPLVWGQTSLSEDIVENEATAFATLHPNPTTGQVTIMGKDLKSAEVFNTLGQRVATATGEGETLQINLSGRPAGIYFVNITDGEGRKCVRKVVKE